MRLLANHDEFARLYTQAEANPDIRKKTMRASELFGLVYGRT